MKYPRSELLALDTHHGAQRASVVAPSCSFTAATNVRTTACGLASWGGRGDSSLLGQRCLCRPDHQAHCHGTQAEGGDGRSGQRTGLQPGPGREGHQRQQKGSQPDGHAVGERPRIVSPERPRQDDLVGAPAKAAQPSEHDDSAPGPPQTPPAVRVPGHRARLDRPSHQVERRRLRSPVRAAHGRPIHGSLMTLPGA